MPTNGRRRLDRAVLGGGRRTRSKGGVYLATLLASQYRLGGLDRYASNMPENQHRSSKPTTSAETVATLQVVHKHGCICSGCTAKRNQQNDGLNAEETGLLTLLQSGVFEGRVIEYRSKSGDIVTGTVTKSGGVACDCERCLGSTIPFVEFEEHAGRSIQEQEGQNTFLKNGTSLRTVCEAANRTENTTSDHARKKQHILTTPVRKAQGRTCTGSIVSRASGQVRNISGLTVIRYLRFAILTVCAWRGVRVRSSRNRQSTDTRGCSAVNLVSRKGSDFRT